MRIWSLHPRYLDAKGLVALWRETLLAKKVLQGRTKGYKNHPQLDRFKKMPKPVAAVSRYLSEIWKEACRRGYTFDRKKVGRLSRVSKMRVTRGQIQYEAGHLRRKLMKRDPSRLGALKSGRLKLHPLFRTVAGGIEEWER